MAKDTEIGNSPRAPSSGSRVSRFFPREPSYWLNRFVSVVTRHVPREAIGIANFIPCLLNPSLLVGLQAQKPLNCERGWRRCLPLIAVVVAWGGVCGTRQPLGAPPVLLHCAAPLMW
jgi:hypothetical protein